MTAPASRSQDEARQGVVAAAREVGGDELARVAERYFCYAAPDDVTGSPAQHAALVARHAALAQARESGTTSVVVEPGLQGTSTNVWVVADDKPFLVDSVSVVLSRAQLPVARLLHPIMGAESWIFVELDAPCDSEMRDLLKATLESALQDVTEAVTCWSAMQAAAVNVVTELTEATSYGADPAEVVEAQSFITWLADEHFLFLAVRERQVAPDSSFGPVTGIGIQRLVDADDPWPQPTEIAGDLVLVGKSTQRSTVHRDAVLDLVTVALRDESGRVTRQVQLVGLLTSQAYTESVLSVPLARAKARRVMELAGFPAGSHSARDLATVLEELPRDEVLHSSVPVLLETATAVVHLQLRPRARLFCRADESGRLVSALFYVPRDRYTTSVRLKLMRILAEAYGGTVDFTTRVTEHPLARLHFFIRIPSGQQMPAVDTTKLEQQLVDATRTWVQDLLEQAKGGDPALAGAVDRFAPTFPEAYKEDFGADTALEDIAELAKLGDDDKDVRVALYTPVDGAADERRLKLFGRGPLTLTRILPMFTDLGLEVTDERPYELDGESASGLHIYDFGLRAPEAVWAQVDEDIFEQAFYAIWTGASESDGLNALALTAGMPWREIVIIRALAGYYRQMGSTFSSRYVEQSVSANPALAKLIVELFVTRFDPAFTGDREAAQAAVEEQIITGLDAVAVLDHDRILRTFMGIVKATLRTNYFQKAADGSPKGYVSMKLLCAKVPNLPMPRPMYEIWVYAPCVEGVHLRFGPVARGGLRWSDRREDFRTEVLGLVKAQMVKNAVIVPTGSKGGFYGKCLVDPAKDRDAWYNGGIEAYKTFIRGLLDLTDNRVGAEIVPPKDVVRHDGDDSYLVVAADKGTAAFSDIANGVAREYGFWLDDAFASGGSAGYDHKGMGITARGAWESVKRHFREIGVDTQTQDFTVVGVGDMSGDVFGNGMLLSEHIKLVCAFDHRDIFIDPNPDTARSFAERQRLFDTPRTSWQDYDRSLISAGGGVFSRSLKSIDITPEMRGALGIADDVTSMTPAELMKAALLAPVDLVWNGGIGTYIKASSQQNSEIGDRANDAIRVNGNEIRAKVIGEGGNLGASQLGRIEAARAGVAVNTDAIDNSAGVDTSDHEVNIKILLTALTREGVISWEQRDEILVSMTEEVGKQVLRDNYEQNVLLGNHRAQGSAMLAVHQRLISWLEERGLLDRAIEFLPTDSQIQELRASGQGLAGPEFSVLIAYAKLMLKRDLIESDFADDPWFASTLAQYFPKQMREGFADRLGSHPLRREIVVNMIANNLVNRGGVSMPFRAMEETGASMAQAARSYVVVREVFGLQDYVTAVEATDNKVDTATQTELYLEFRRLMDRALRWLLNARTGQLDIAAEIETFQGKVQQLMPMTGDLLVGREKAAWEARRDAMLDKGVPEALAVRYAGLIDSFSFLDIVELASEHSDESLEQVAATYFAAMDRLGIDSLLDAVVALPRQDRWDALARGAMRYDLYAVLRQLASHVLTSTPASGTGAERVAQWATTNPDMIERAERAISGVAGLERSSLAPLSVALRSLRSAIR